MKDGRNVFDILMDEDSEENVVLYDKDNNPTEFEQISLILLDDNDYYAILRPVNKVKGLDDDEVLIFKLVEDEDYKEVRLVSDINIINEVLDVFNQYLEEDDK